MPDPRPWLAALAPYLESDDLRIPLELPIVMPIGTTIREVQGISLRLPHWQGPPFVDDYGKKSAGMVELDGEHLFAELAVLRLLERDGWSGRWVCPFGGAKAEVWKYLTAWTDVPREEQRNRPIEEAEPRQLLARVAGMNRPARFAGCWDVYAWRGSRMVFFECKRASARGKDVLKPAQIEWLRAALYLSDPRLRVDDFCFVLWDYQ